MSNIKVDTIKLPAFTSAPVEQYRIMILEDRCEYQHGDYEDTDAGAAEREYIEEQIANHGVWGYVVEKWADAHPVCKACGSHPVPARWEHVDSCFGFIGGDGGYMMSEALASIPEGYGKVSVVDENGREINKVVRK